MTRRGRLAGRYNIVVADRYSQFDHQIPMEEFVTSLERGDVPDEVSVVGLESVLQDEAEMMRVRRLMDDRANDLEFQNPKIQFVVEGNFHRNRESFDLKIGDEFHSLRPLFGTKLKRHDDGDWLEAFF